MQITTTSELAVVSKVNISMHKDPSKLIMWIIKVQSNYSRQAHLERQESNKMLTLQWLV